MDTTIFLWLALPLALYQLFISILIARADEYTRVQKVTQALLVWIVPLFGALVCHIVLWSARKAYVPRDTKFTEPGADPGLGSDGGVH